MSAPSREQTTQTRAAEVTHLDDVNPRRSGSKARPNGASPGTPLLVERQASPLADVDSDERPCLLVTRWSDPVIDVVGYDAAGDYPERFWMPIMGPSSVALLRRLNSELERAPEGFPLDLGEAARWLGVATRTDPRGTIVRTVERCCTFGLARSAGHRHLAIRRFVPPLSYRQIRHLPDGLREEHVEWQRQAIQRCSPEGAEGSSDVVQRRCRALAVSMLQVGESEREAERQLHRWRFHPAMAHEAIRWAKRQLGTNRRRKEA